MSDFLVWVEGLSFATWVRESPSMFAFPTFLTVHTIGISMVAGGSAVIAFALLGMWPRAALKPLDRLYGPIWFGFAINAFTGLGLLMAHATTAAMNPDFWVKMLFVIGGVVLMMRIRRLIFRSPVPETGPLPSSAKAMAWGSLACWFGAIVAGRLIAYVGPVSGI